MNSLALSVIVLVAATNAVSIGPYELPSGFRDILRGARAFVENFSCENRPYGYYADVDNDCQIFHICVPVLDDLGALVETNRFSFICGNGTLFSQDTLTCVGEAEALPCPDAANLYEAANALFGNILSNFTVNAPDGSSFLDRVRNVAAARLQSQGQEFASSGQNTGFDNQNQNTGFDNQNQNTGFDNQNQNTGFDNQNQNNGFDSQSQFTGSDNQDQNGGFSDANSGITNVLGDNSQGGFSGFSDSNQDVQFS